MAVSDRLPAILAALIVAGVSATSLRAQAADPVPPAPMPRHGMAWGTERYILSEVLEIAPVGRDATVRFDLVGWIGGPSQRVWMKADGALAADGGQGRTELQALYGRLVAPFWDLQAGIWLDADVGTGAMRGLGGGALGVQGLAPGWFEVEPVLLLSTGGDLGARLTASYDLYVTQRLVVQPRAETSAWLRSLPEFGVGSGIGESELALRARYEVRREFAPYIGVVWERRFGASGALARAAGVGDRGTFVALGVRAWW